MKGLFIKDYCLLRKQKTAVIMIVLLAVFFMITGDDPSMGVSYTIFVANSIIMGTQSFDEADHGMAFLMTLPTGRKLYVKEKYLFGILNVFALWIVMVAAGLADKCEIQLAYAIGVAHPVSILVDSFGTGKVSDAKLAELVEKHFDMRPAAIIRDLDLRRPIYKQVAAYGHMGRTDIDVPWEKTDKVEALRASAGI